MQAFQTVIGIVDLVTGTGLKLGQAAVAVCAVGIGILFTAALSSHDPALDIQAVIGVVQVLRALKQGSGAVLRAADRSAEGIILKGVAAFLRRAVAVGQLCQGAFGIIGICDIRNNIKKKK